MRSVPRPVTVQPGPEAGVPGDVAQAPPRDLDGFLASVERRAFRLAELALGQRDDALDAVQEAMIRLLRYRHRPPEEWPPLFWSILRRQMTDRHRRNSLRRRFQGWLGRPDEDESDPLENLPDPGPDPLGQHLRELRWHALGQALRQLPTRQRECFLLRELQGLSVADTAAAMGCSEGSVKTHLSRAMSALRGKMEQWQ
jgi:RNA polymerase sigma-70 factor (ECF subfamily)